jgi:hypothetical protein
MRVLQLLKIPYAILPYLLLHLKILHKLPLLLKIHKQPLEHHSPLRVAISKSYPHTTPPLQNPPPTQPLEYHSLLRQSPPHTTTPPQNSPTEQALQHHSPPHVDVSKSPPHTTLLLIIHHTHTPLEHHSLLCKSPPHTTTPSQNPPIKQTL